MTEFQRVKVTNQSLSDALAIAQNGKQVSAAGSSENNIVVIYTCPADTKAYITDIFLSWATVDSISGIVEFMMAEQTWRFYLSAENTNFTGHIVPAQPVELVATERVRIVSAALKLHISAFVTLQEIDV